ncbi:MAG: PAS domain S-box protein [Proteobacteria bacterium]|nr:PAS domain S-box protein [Pseudomonadota bacterium]
MTLLGKKRASGAGSHLRLLLIVFVFLVFLAVGLGGYRITIYRILKTELQERTLATDNVQVEMGAQAIYGHQKNILDTLFFQARHRHFIEAFVSRNSEALASQLSDLVQNPELISVYLLDVAGDEVQHLSSPSSPPSMPVIDKRWFDGILRGRTRYFSGPVVFAGRSEPSLILNAIPFDGPDGRLLGVLAAFQKLDVWAAFFSKFPVQHGRCIYLLDEFGRPVASSSPEGGCVSPPSAEAARLIGDGHTAGEAAGALVAQSGTDRPVFLSVARVPLVNWVLLITSDYHTAMAPMRAMLININLFLGFIAICLIALGGLLYARYRVQKQALTMAENQSKQLEAEVGLRTGDLDRSTKRYRNLVEKMPDIIYETDEAGRLTFVSSATKSVLGFEPEEMVGAPWRNWVYEDDRGKFDEQWARLAQGYDAPPVLSLRHIDREGQLRWLSIHSRAVFDGRKRFTGWQGVSRDITKEIQTDQRIRELSHQLIRAQEEERHRLALDLHDEMGQVLSALKIGLYSLLEKGATDQEQTGPEIEKLIQLSQKIMNRIRTLAYHLRPAILDNFGLEAAAADLCESLAEDFDVTITPRISRLEEDRLSPEVKTTMFRFIQEGLTNAVRYSGSDQISVELLMRGSILSATIRDSGQGFNVDQALDRALAEKKLGLWGMSHRLELIGGRLLISSSPAGTVLEGIIDIGGGHDFKVSGSHR